MEENRFNKLSKLKNDIIKHIKQYGKTPDEISLTSREIKTVKWAKEMKLDLSIEVDGKKYHFPHYKRMW